MKENQDNSDDIKNILNKAQERMIKTEGSFQKDLNSIRSTRASASMLDHVQVDYYETLTPLNQLASIGVPEARMLIITPYDKSAIGDIEKALHKSDIGITPQNDGNVIRLVMPELSTERRQELVKQLKGRLEEARVSLRNIRRDSNEDVKKLKSAGHSEDEIKGYQNEVQKLTDRFIQKCEALASSKEKSILTV